jgi:hypothetical protein
LHTNVYRQHPGRERKEGAKALKQSAAVRKSSFILLMEFNPGQRLADIYVYRCGLLPREWILVTNDVYMRAAANIK